MKALLFRFFPEVAVLGLIVAFSCIFGLDLDAKPPLIGGSIAVALGFCYFIQQQRLAETRLFKELFTEFNRRYDVMNEALANIAPMGAATSDEQLIIDYLNL